MSKHLTFPNCAHRSDELADGDSTFLQQRLGSVPEAVVRGGVEPEGNIRNIKIFEVKA